MSFHVCACLLAPDVMRRSTSLSPSGVPNCRTYQTRRRTLWPSEILRKKKQALCFHLERNSRPPYLIRISFLPRKIQRYTVLLGCRPNTSTVDCTKYTDTLSLSARKIYCYSCRYDIPVDILTLVICMTIVVRTSHLMWGRISGFFERGIMTSCQCVGATKRRFCL